MLADGSTNARHQCSMWKRKGVEVCTRIAANMECPTNKQTPTYIYIYKDHRFDTAKSVAASFGPPGISFFPVSFLIDVCHFSLKLVFTAIQKDLKGCYPSKTVFSSISSPAFFLKGSAPRPEVMQILDRRQQREREARFPGPISRDGPHTPVDKVHQLAGDS